MPVSESGLSSPVEQLDTVPGGKSPNISSKVSRQNSSSKKQKSRETGGDEKLRRQMSRELSEDKIRRQMHKQESKDSGIVTEMYTRPKEYTQDSKSKKPSRSSSMKASRTGSVKNKDKVENFAGSGDIETEDPNEVRNFMIFIFFSNFLFFRNLGNHLYSKVYETQEDLCRKRNEIRMGNMKLASIRAQVSDYFTIPVYRISTLVNKINWFVCAG